MADHPEQDLVLLTDANMPILKDKDLAAIDSDVLGTIKHYRSSVKKVDDRVLSLLQSHD